MSVEISAQDDTSHGVETRASLYDRINAILVASLVLVGFLFGTLCLIWLTSVLDFSQRTGPGGTVIPTPDGDDTDVIEENDVDPGVDEFPEVETLQLASHLQAVPDVVSSIRASQSNAEGDALNNGPGKDERRKGIPGPSDTDPGVEHLRWKISYEALDIDTYAQMLSRLDIELGVVHETKQSIIRIADPADEMRVIASNRAEQNRLASLYFMHEKQRMKRWDVALAKRAGVDVNDSFTVQFYSRTTCQRIREAEAKALQEAGRSLKEVFKTRLSVQPKDGGYQFVVTSIEYR